MSFSKLARYLPFLVIFIAAVAIMGANPFKGETVAPTDLLLALPGWQSLASDLPVRHWQRSDALDYKIPAWIYLKQKIRTGELPLWNDSLVNGIPGVQMATRSAFTPAFLVFLVVPDDAAGFYYANLVNLLLAALGTYLFLHCFLRNRLASLFGAFVFSFSGFNAAWFYWHHVNTSIWIPWVLYFVAAFIQTREVRFLPAIAAVSALMLLGGFPIVALYGFIAAGLLAVVLLWSEEKRFLAIFYSGWPIALAVGGSLILTLFALVPLFEQLGHADITYRTGAAALGPSEFARFWYPWSEDQPHVEKTIYSGLTALILSALGVLLIRQLSAWRFVLWALVLLAFSISIAFGLAPHDWIRAIPGIGTNPWSRMSVLFGLGMAVLSSAVIAEALSRSGRHRRWASLLAVGLILVQFADQKTLFNRFNGPVPAASFFPETASLTYVSDHLGPLQSAIADSGGFLFAGTLTSYGIREWFAHDFKSGGEKESLSRLVEASHRTPTAGTPSCTHVEYEQGLQALYGVKFILCRATEPVVHRSNRKLAKRPSLALPAYSPVYVVKLPGELEITSLSLLVGTYRRDDLSGQLRLQIRSDRDVLGDASVDMAGVEDNSWVRFQFDPSIRVGPGQVSLVPEWENPTPGAKLSLWSYHAMADSANYINTYRTGKGLHISRKNEFGLKLNGKIVDPLRSGPGTPVDPTGFREIRLEAPIRILENEMMGDNGLYFLDRLDETAKPAFSPVRLESYRSDHIQLDYQGQDGGWVVLPMRFYPGWRARVNGQDVEHIRFMDIMPAIPVDGPSRIDFRYVPWNFYIAAAISLSGWVILFIFVFRLRSR